MATYQGGMTARTGYYYNRATWELTPLKSGEVLQGSEADRYTRIPALALLVIAPVLGAVFAMFLPFIGFAMLFGFLVKKVAGDHLPAAVNQMLMGPVMATATGQTAAVPPARRPGDRTE